MPSIFVATDFSPISDNAVSYAAGLARQWRYDLHLLHAYFVPVTFNDPAMPVMPVDNLKGISEERMDKMLAYLQETFPDVPITTTVEYGDIQDTIADAVKKLNPALIVVGSHGEDDADMWMGSTTLDLLRSAYCPVLAVPPAAQFTGIDKICLALDLNNEQVNIPLGAIGAIQAVTGAAFHLLHVIKDGEAAIPDLENNTLVKSMGLLKITATQAATEGDVDDTITAVAEREGMQWLAVIPQHHSFWDSLFHKSHTKAVVKRSHIPVLALHGNGEQ